MSQSAKAKTRRRQYWRELRAKTWSLSKEHFAWVYPIVVGVVTFGLIFAIQGTDKMMENLIPSICAAGATAVVAIGLYFRSVGNAATDIFSEQLDAVEVIEKEADRLRAELLSPASQLQLMFEPNTVPYEEEIPRREPQIYILPGSDKPIRGMPREFMQRVFRVCAKNTGPDPFDQVAVLLSKLEPAVPRVNDVPLHQMHDNNAEGVFQQIFSLGAYDHKFVDVVFKNSDENRCRVYHAAQHVDQQLPARAYTATLCVKARGYKPQFYRYEINIDNAGGLSFKPCS